MARNAVGDAQVEVQDLMGYCGDINDFVETVKTIIYGRKERINSKTDSFENKIL